MEKDKIIYELENKIKELEEKHYNECRQISEYEEENRKLKEELERNNAENPLRQHIMNRFMDVK